MVKITLATENLLLKSKPFGKGRVGLQRRIEKFQLLWFDKIGVTNLTHEKFHFKITFVRMKFTVTRLSGCSKSRAMDEWEFWVGLDLFVLIFLN